MPSHPKGKLGISHEQAISFDDKGRAVVAQSIPSIGMQVEIRGWLTGPDALYDITMESPERLEWRGITADEEIRAEIRLKWGSTPIKVTIQSNKPNTTAHFHLTA